MQYKYEIIIIKPGREYGEKLASIIKANFSLVTLHEVSKSEEIYALISQRRDLTLVIIDLELQDENPQDIYERLMLKSPEIPIYFFGTKNLASLYVPDNIYLDNAANEYLEYPFHVDFLIEKINLAKKVHEDRQDEDATIEADAENYIPMRIRSFYRFQDVPYDAYISVGDNYFRRIIKANVRFTQSMITKYVKKNQKFIYFEKKEYIDFLEKSIKVLVKIFNTPGVETLQILTTQITATSVIHEYIRTLGVSPNVVRLTEEVIRWNRKIFDREKNFANILKQFPNENFDLATQSVLIAYLCEALLYDMQWNSDLGRKKIGLATILHDCYLTNEDLVKIRSINDPDLDFFTDDEIEEYKTHGRKAAEMCQYFNGFSEVDFIISEHHELPMAKGFPRKMNGFDIQPISCIFIMSKNFVTGLSQGGIGQRQATKDLLDKFVAAYAEGNFKAPLRSLKRIIYHSLGLKPKRNAA